MASSRPAQGQNNPKPPPGPAYKSDAAPKVVSRGTVSRPQRLGAWRPGTLVADVPPKIVQR